MSAAARSVTPSLGAGAIDVGPPHRARCGCRGHLMWGVRSPPEQPEDDRVSTVDPAPGWYPDPTNAAGTRWWDGRSWTQYRSGQQLLVQPPLPESLSTSTRWIVLQALIPLVQVLAEVPYMLAFRSLFLSQLSIMQRFPDGSATLPPAAADELAGRFAGLFGVFGLTSLLYLALSALWVVFAVLDARRLRPRGI